MIRETDRPVDRPRRPSGDLQCASDSEARKSTSGSLPQRSPQERGMALILVILVLSALLMIGTPFVLSMILQEQGASQSVAKERARLAAHSARNHAVAHLFSTHPSRERGQLMESDLGDLLTQQVPAEKVDELAELSVSFPSELLIEPISQDEEAAGIEAEALSTYTMRSGQGQILSASIEDEQGKVNLNTAPPILLGNLLGGTQLSERIQLEESTTEIPVLDTSVFETDDDPDTVDGIVVIMNPLIFTMEAISYRGKTDTHLTGCFRGEYLSVPQEHAKGWPVFDLRAFKVYLHRYYNAGDGEIRTYRTPQAIREIAEWSIVPYFLENLAALGLNLRNIEDFGLTGEMLLRAGLDEMLLERKEVEEYDEKAYRKAKRALKKSGISAEMIELLEKFRGPVAMIEAAEVLGKLEGGGFGMALLTDRVEKEVKKQLKRIQKNTKKYFPKAIEAYKEIYDQPGMETFSARDYGRIRDLITTTSRVPVEWSDEQMVIGEISNNSLVGFPSLQVANYSWFNPGTLVRVRSNSDPSKVEYHIAMGAIPSPSGGGRGAQLRGAVFAGGVVLKENLRFKYEEREAMVSAMLRHPVNINSAPERVIRAILSGLSVVNQSASVRWVVDSKEAAKLAAKIVDSRPIQGFEHLKVIVTEAKSEGILDHDRDVRTILTNAQNPNHNTLSVSSVGFCYTTGDVYSIEASGVVNGPSGIELASHRIREVVEVAPPDPLEIVLDSQDDWAYRSFIRPAPTRPSWGRLGMWLPAREGNEMITLPVPLHRRAWEIPSQAEGTFKALTTESEFQNQNYGFGAIAFAAVEHFPETIEGIDTAQGTHTMSNLAQGTSGSGGSGGTAGGTGGGSSGLGPAGTVTGVAQDQALSFIPGTIDFWVKPNWSNRSQDRTFFDTIADTTQQERNRIRLFFDSETQSIVFQVMDDAAPPRPSFAPGVTSIPSNVPLTGGGEIRHRVTPTTFANDTWYHITATWSSTKPGDQLLMIDQRPVGEHKWATTLRSPLSINSNRMPNLEDNGVVDFPASWPQVGSLLVGTEVIDYQGNQITQRGARGSVRQNHPRGTPVSLFGYAVDAVPSDPSIPIEVAGDRMLIPTGGAKVGRTLLIPRGPDGVPETFGRTVSIDNPGHFTPTTQSIIVVDDPGLRGFPSQGYLFVAAVMQDATGFYIDTGQWEYIRYTALRVTDDGSGGQAYEFFNLIRNPVNLNSLDTTAQSGQVARLVVYSVGVETDVDNLSELYPPSGVIQIDRGVGGNAAAPEVEWIRYWMIAEDKYFLGRPFLAAWGFRGFTGNVTHVANLLENNRPITDVTAITEHPAGQSIVPVLRATKPFLAQEDWVSVGDSEGPIQARQSEPGLIRIRIARNTDLGNFFSFEKQPVNTYRIGGNPQIKKFPSGDLPSVASDLIYFGGSPASGLDGAGPLESIIDEIRLSRAGRSDFSGTALPTRSGRLILDDVPPPSGQPTNVRRKAIRTWYTKNDDPGSGGGLDRIRLVGTSHLVAGVDSSTGNTVGLEYQPEDPRSFGMGKPEGLVSLGGEICHYEFESGDPFNEIRVQLVQDLPRDALFTEDENLDVGIDRVIDPRRDLRSEVIPVIEIAPVAGTLPQRDTFLEFVNDGRKEVIYYERRSGNNLYNVLRGQLGTEVGSYIYQWQWQSRTGVVTETNEWFLRVLNTREVDVRMRGMLNSERRDMTLGRGGVIPLTHIPVTRSAGPITSESLPVRDAAGFPQQFGYAIVDDGNLATRNEIIGYQQRSNNLLLLAQEDRTGNGIFRGRFGTPKRGTLGSDVTLVSFPARYHDHFEAQVESPALMYLQRAFHVPGAHWDQIGWQEEEQRNTTFDNEVWVLARLDGAPEWDQEPTNEPGGLYLFKGEGGEIDAAGDLLEVRIMFRYPEGAYGPNSTSAGGGWNDTWKHSPVMNTLNIEYRKQWRTVHREDLPF